MRLLRIKTLVGFVVFLCFFQRLDAQQVVANAGADRMICPGDTAILGGNPTGSGLNPPFTYVWSPATGLSSTTVSNPVAKPTATTIYYLRVRNSIGDIGEDTVKITLDSISLVTAGRDTSICENASVKIGGTNTSTDASISYSWSPATGLSSTNILNPTATPAATTTYTLTVKSSKCPPFETYIKVSVYPPPAINAGPDVTIDEGDVVTLNASGAKIYQWSPPTKPPNSPNPEVDPKVTTWYYVYGTDNFGCWGIDSVLVTVRPREGPVFYNTFTPNADGVNDFFFIGNLNKYPDNRLEIYNRYGKQVYKAVKYANNWDGKSLGEELPAATYYFIFDPGNEEKTYRGSVTIIR